AYPHPVQQPHPHILVGGRSPGAYRRAVTMAHGWYGWGQDPAAAAQAVKDLHAAEERYGRVAELGALEVNVTPLQPVDRELAARYAAAGVHRLILRPPSAADAQGIEQFVVGVGETLIGRV
ncbi:MAG TPA: LLM class flavin-dependent oxidoreductase, partial [Herpetosiphonaceae bacterium]|nr:LLM class flavin-dependent oxidoreductase [Herpetosiphonaceae bacterium]